MSENHNHSAPKWIIVLLVALTALVVLQAVWLYQVTRPERAPEPSAATSAVTKPNSPPVLAPAPPFQPFDPQDWDPFEEMRRMREEMDLLFGEALNRFSGSGRFEELFDPDFALRPRIDVEESEGAYIVTVDLPGVEASRIETELNDRTLTITAETEVVSETEEEGEFIRRERHAGRFQRSIVFETPVEPEGMQQSFKDGVLEIHVPKAEVEE